MHIVDRSLTTIQNASGFGQYKTQSPIHTGSEAYQYLVIYAVVGNNLQTTTEGWILICKPWVRI